MVISTIHINIDRENNPLLSPEHLYPRCSFHWNTRRYVVYNPLWEYKRGHHLQLPILYFTTLTTSYLMTLCNYIIDRIGATCESLYSWLAGQTLPHQSHLYIFCLSGGQSSHSFGRIGATSKPLYIFFGRSNFTTSDSPSFYLSEAKVVTVFAAPAPPVSHCISDWMVRFYHISFIFIVFIWGQLLYINMYIYIYIKIKFLFNGVVHNGTSVLAHYKALPIRGTPAHPIVSLRPLSKHCIDADPSPG